GSSTVVGEAISIYIYDSAFSTPISAREFIVLNASDIGGPVAFSVPEVLLTPGKYLVTFKTYSDAVTYKSSDLYADPNTVFVDPSAGGTWYNSTSIPVVRLNVSDDLHVCDLQASAICTGGGTAYATATNGMPPYSFIWSTGDSTPVGFLTCIYWSWPYVPDTVFVTDSKGCKASKLVCCPVGIKENEFEGDISIFPNPNNGQFVLEVLNVTSGNYEAEIINYLGQQVYRNTIVVNGYYAEKIDVSGFSAGMYMLKLTDKEGRRVIKKLVIE
ncbi:MAG: T9SS type A sorting domain-containing protein, partial [Salibacteraceae bacterium]